MEAMENIDEVDWSHERERLKMRITVLEESVKSCEVECKVSRETVLKLVAELDRERRRAASSVAAFDTLKAELDGLEIEKRSVESEKQTLTERLEASKRVTEAARRESDCLEKQLEEIQKKLQTSLEETQSAEGKLQTFLNKVAATLQGNPDDIVLSTEDDILHKVDSLCNKRVSSMQAMLSEQTELHHKALQRGQLAEEQVQDLRKRLECVETEMLTADMHRDGLQLNNQHYEEFLEQLSETLRVESIAVDLGFDMRLKLILSRAKQLVKQEGTALVESKTMTYSLQRKLKSQKDQLESKGLHVQLLRKKVSELEEERSHSSLAQERDGAQLEIRRLLKKMERLQAELRTTKASNTELRAQLVHTNELKLKVMEQNQTIQEQEKKLDQLEERKAKVEKKLSTVSSDLKSQEKKSKEDQKQLCSLRQSLDQLFDRETALLDFRMVISQMIGLDTLSLALPNSEIIKILETILHTHHCHHHPHCYDWSCPAHQRPHLPQIHHLPNSSLNASTSRSTALLH